jgi:ubiquinone/menaquinone biosynthesis C-methylase UbiE
VSARTHWAATSVKKLSDDRLATFDHDYVSDAAFTAIRAHIDHDFPDGRFTFIDIGGGMGFFADRILAEFPLGTGVVLDNSDMLLYQNAEHPRKRLVLGSGTELTSVFPRERFDIAFFNFTLHHFIGKGYDVTRALQRESLREAEALLGPRGRISVSEITYNGLLVDNLPSHVVFRLTTNQRFAPFVKRLGANTAGTGVCFLSRRAWSREFAQLGFTQTVILREPAPQRKLYAWARLFGVGAGDVSNTHFWLQPR